MAIDPRGMLRQPLLILLSMLLLACSDSSDRNPSDPDKPPVEPPQPGPTYQADIIWTNYGIPHITADDWGSAGYGSGYALARENFCTLMWAYVMAAGDTARYKGDEGNLSRDLLFKAINDDAAVDRMWADLPEFMHDYVGGYAAGVNRFLNEKGLDKLADGPEGCRGAEWVREISTDDVVRSYHMLVLYASSFEVAPLVAAASPDNTVAHAALPPAEELAQMLYAQVDPARAREALGLPSHEEMGSNAYAVGADASQSSSGILLGNPHFPWQGNRRFFMFHLTVGEEYDVMGAALIGGHVPLIAFNKDLAWSHTVSTGQRFTFYELTLNPENKLQYLYDGEYRDIQARTVSVGKKTEDGSVEEIEHTLYFSHFGPIVDLGAINDLGAGWPNAFGSIVAYRDVNLENLRILEQMVRKGQAADLDEFKQALRAMGNPWANTIAADRYGDAFYGDITATPHVSIAKTKECVRTVAQNFLTQQGILSMDGSDPACEWGSDEGVPEGIFNYDNMPKLETRQYAANANDSYWLPNPRNLTTGYPIVIGREEVPQTIRTRHTFSQAERRLAGQDAYGEAGFNIDSIRQLHYQATNHAAELVADDVVDICQEVSDWSVYSDDPAMAEEACDVLADWDKSHRLDSVGGHIFHEFWKLVPGIENFWSVPFDPAQPVGTPGTLNLDPQVVEDVRHALADAAAALKAAGIPLDRPWGEVQYADKNGERIGIHGSSGSMMFSNIASPLVDGEGYSQIASGNSYIQAVTWDESDCPDAYAILTYSQSTDPASDHYADSTRLYSEGGWIDMPFCEMDRESQEISRETISE